jgi:hypothetical protein
MSEMATTAATYPTSGPERIAHLEMLQKSSIVVEVLSLAMKITAIATVALFVGFAGLGHASGSLVSIVQIGVFALLICLWLSDGNYRASKWAYAELFKEAREGHVALFDMNYLPYKKGPGKAHKGLFTPHAFFYVVLAAVVVGKVFLAV